MADLSKRERSPADVARSVAAGDAMALNLVAGSMLLGALHPLADRAEAAQGNEPRLAPPTDERSAADDASVAALPVSPPTEIVADEGTDSISSIAAALPQPAAGVRPGVQSDERAPTGAQELGPAATDSDAHTTNADALPASSLSGSAPANELAGASAAPIANASSGATSAASALPDLGGVPSIDFSPVLPNLAASTTALVTNIESALTSTVGELTNDISALTASLGTATSTLTAPITNVGDVAAGLTSSVGAQLKELTDLTGGLTTNLANGAPSEALAGLASLPATELGGSIPALDGILLAAFGSPDVVGDDVHSADEVGDVAAVPAGATDFVAGLDMLDMLSTLDPSPVAAIGMVGQPYGEAIDLHDVSMAPLGGGLHGLV